jgi:DNA-binding winged helix-turn-helix (wHTH) protein
MMPAFTLPIERVLRFDDCELNIACFSLTRNGRLQKVEPKVFDLLVYLVCNANRVVSKAELFTHVWPNEVVSAASLTQCISAVRRAIGDTGANQRLVATISKRGYRFIAPVYESEYTAPLRGPKSVR